MDLFTDAAALIGLAFWVVGIGVGVLVAYTVIRLAVRRALRDHQEWLEERGLR